jgi:hypothetical protein
MQTFNKNSDALTCLMKSIKKQGEAFHVDYNKFQNKIGKVKSISITTHKEEEPVTKEPVKDKNIKN